jgi:O-methyltransferase
MRLPGAGVVKFLTRALKKLAHTARADVKELVPEISPDEIALMQRFQPYTMTGVERQWALISVVKHLNGAKVDGALVECGVWRGGNMLIAKQICRDANADRKFYLFDTFAGMSEPSAKDVTHSGSAARAKFEQRKREDHVDWDYASLEDVTENFRRAGLLDESVIFVPGKVEATLRDPKNVPERIALLRLDTDWYESTKLELEVLYPKLVPGGVLILDDYGHWRGAREAVDEYFHGTNVLMHRIDYTGRMIVRG